VSLIEYLEEAVRRDIALHEELKAHVELERALFEEDRFDDIGKRRIQRNQLEHDIAQTNELIDGLVKELERTRTIVEASQKKILASLVEELHACIADTIQTIEKTGEALNCMKQATGETLKGMTRRKTAIYSYVQNS